MSEGGNYTEVPLPFVAMVGTVLAFAFNLGFFWMCGLAFITLFTVQEHVIFSVTGAFVVLVVGVVALNVYNIIDKESDYPIKGKLFWIINNLALVAVTVAFTVSVVLGFNDEYGPQVAIPIFVVIAIVLLAMGVDTALPNQPFRRVMIMAVAVTAAFMSGVVYGNQAIYGHHGLYKTYVVTKASKTFGLVRAGLEYSIVVTNGPVLLAVRTADLDEIGYNMESTLELGD